MHSAWATAKLGTIASVVASNVDKHVYEDEIPVRLCNYLDVYRNRRLSQPYQFSQGSVTQAELDRFTIRKGDVLITKDSETPDDIGVPCLIAEDFEKAVCGYHLALIRPEEVLNPSFLSYLFESEATRRYFLAKAAGLTRFGLNTRIIRGVPIPMLPPDEQAAIANVLDAVECAISNAKAVIAKAEHLQKGLMQQLLTGRIKPDGTLRSLDDFTPDKEFAQIPKSWRSCKFKDLLREGAITGIQDGNHGEKHPTQDDYVKEGIPFIMACDISSGEVDLERAKKIPKQLADSLRIGFSVKDDVLLSHKASIGFTAIVGDVDPYIMLTPQVTYYRCNPEKLLPKFLNLFFRSFRFQRVLDALSVQSTRNYIGITNQKGLPILYPPDVEEQSAIANSLSTVDDSIRTKRKKIAVLQRLKRSLMQNLLTGRVLLPAKGAATEVTS